MRMSRSRRGKQHQQQRARQRREGHQRENVGARDCRCSSHSHPDHEGNHHRRAGRDPSRIRANVAGLHVANFVGNVTRAVGGVVHRGIDYLSVNSLPEDSRRAVDQRLDEKRGVKFVDVVLVQTAV